MTDAPIKFLGYGSRWDLIVAKCRDKRVLHLGCIGMTEESLERKCQAMSAGEVLHPHLRKAARELVGVDYDGKAVAALNAAGFTEIICCNVYSLAAQLAAQAPFDVVLCGDLIEHLSEPGRMLTAVKATMTRDSELLITTPNAYGIINLIRYGLGRHTEGGDHVLSFNVFSLRNLLSRSGFTITELRSCYDRKPCGMLGRV
ncbi:MAG: class I SAM-dependent methyltransferase, partial [Candidatus Binataceae bacterium]